MRLLAAMLIFPLIGGCTVSPSINVLGAYFPDWMFCIFGAIVVVVLVRVAVRAMGRAPEAKAMILPLAYFALTVVLALGSWLLFFSN